MSEQVALLDSINPAATAAFTDAGLAVVEFPKSVTPAEFADVVSDIRLLGVRSGPRVPGDVIDAGDNLEAIGCFCVGTNHVDREAADRSGVAIFNSRHENTRSVAELVMGNVYGLLRRIPEHSGSLHAGVWTKTDERSYEVRGKTIGIIGYGNIGAQVSVLAEAAGMDVVYYDSAPQSPPHGRATLMPSMEDVLEKADVVTLHVPSGIRIDAKAISRMKPGSYLINAARGDIVDYEAVAEALSNGQLAGVAVDVYEQEPAKQGDHFDHVLRSVIGNVILTPHIGASTIEAQRDIGRKVANRLLGYLATGNSVGSVNVPELPLNGLQPGASRLLHIHKNVPGVIAHVSDIINAAGLNIAGTTHRSRGEFGYVAFDVEGTVAPDDIEQIDRLEETRRTRVITGN
jgi:D-3-phosphoglycerate dehydrogenase / 2-oxoglutarate reductase